MVLIERKAICASGSCGEAASCSTFITVLPLLPAWACSTPAKLPSALGERPLVNCERNCRRTWPALLNCTASAFSSAFSRTTKPGAARSRPQVATTSSQGLGSGSGLPSSVVAVKTSSAAWPTR